MRLIDPMDSSPEAQLARFFLGGALPSILMTDAYKFSMAKAGMPLQQESFYLSFRRTGNYFIPINIAAVIRQLVPTSIQVSERDELHRQGYVFTDEMAKAFDGPLEIVAAPKGAWVRQGEPILSIRGPSLLVSWLEAMCIWLNFPIQVATAAICDGQRAFRCSCKDEAAIVKLVLEVVSTITKVDVISEANVTIEEELFVSSVRQNVLDVRNSLGSGNGNFSRVFEVGMRGATCMEMHRLALQSAADVGLQMTSNVALAADLGLRAVGSTGHEHQLRFGDDASAFRAIRDCGTGAPSYLFDTFDATRLGIPAAIEVLQEHVGVSPSVRFDSGDTEAQLRQFVRAGVSPTYIFMDGMDAGKIKAIEELAEKLKITPKRRLYGVGGFFGCSALPHGLTRNRVSAVYKLSQSGNRPVMKFSQHGKESLPGELTILQRIDQNISKEHMPLRLIAQQSENVAGYATLASFSVESNEVPIGPDSIPSPETQQRMDDLRRKHLLIPTER